MKPSKRKLRTKDKIAGRNLSNDHDHNIACTDFRSAVECYRITYSILTLCWAYQMLESQPTALQRNTTYSLRCKNQWMEKIMIKSGLIIDKFR